MNHKPSKPGSGAKCLVLQEPTCPSCVAHRGEDTDSSFSYTSNLREKITKSHRKLSEKFCHTSSCPWGMAMHSTWGSNQYVMHLITYSFHTKRIDWSATHTLDSSLLHPTLTSQKLRSSLEFSWWIESQVCWQNMRKIWTTMITKRDLLWEKIPQAGYVICHGVTFP